MLTVNIVSKAFLQAYERAQAGKLQWEQTAPGVPPGHHLEQWPLHFVAGAAMRALPFTRSLSRIDPSPTQLRYRRRQCRRVVCGTQHGPHGL
jgi:hypothetical protein